MKIGAMLLAAALLGLCSCEPTAAGSEPVPPLPQPPPAAKIEPLYRNDFSTLEVGVTPAEFLVIDGEFVVAQDGDNKLLRLPVQGPTEHGFLCGPVKRDGITVQARIRAEKWKRQFPQFGVGLNGLEGLRLKLLTATGMLELSLNGEKLAEAPCGWESGQWIWFQLQSVARADGGWTVSGKAWADGATEPKEFQLTATVTGDLDAGRASVWSAPFSKTISDIDDVTVTPVAP